MNYNDYRKAQTKTSALEIAAFIFVTVTALAMITALTFTAALATGASL
tara:strand:+ start:17659 stop:17802 length:144 start_codon:yes stop_codon:yes gene_type:complete